MLTPKQLKLFENELKEYKIIIKKTEAGRVVTVEKLKIDLGSENIPSDSIPKRPRNPRKLRRK